MTAFMWIDGSRPQQFLPLWLAEEVSCPSPLTGEGSGGGGASAASPHPDLPPRRRDGDLTRPQLPRQPLVGEDTGGGKAHTAWHIAVSN
jgi:hypothetical protein